MTTCTALVKYTDRWAVEDPVLDHAILRHDSAVLRYQWLGTPLPWEEPVDEKDRYVVMRAEHDDTCAECHDQIEAQAWIVWDTYEYAAYHKDCAKELA
jgi:hypothetical protein